MAALSGVNIHWSDGLVLALYFMIVIGFGIWSSCKNRGSIAGYFLAGRNMHFILVGASLFASNIGSGHFVGIAGSAADSGLAIAGFEINAILTLIMLGWLYVPVYIHAGVYTMPEYLKKRYGGERIRVFLAVVALLLSIFTKISVDLLAGAIFLQQALNWNIYVSVIFLVLLAAMFTIGGGLTAVIWTDFIQTIIMVIGAFTLMSIGFARLGGLQYMKMYFPYAISNYTLLSKTQCGIAPPYYFSFMRPLDSDLPWLSSIGFTISGMWYWCSDQVIVQRTLAAKNMDHVKAGCLLAGFIKILPLFIIAFPGMISRVMWPNEIGCSDPDICTQICNSASGCNDISFPLVVLRIMPNGIRGLMLAVMIAALMSSLTSIFNSSSTIFTVDIYQRIRVNSKEWELMVVGRVFVLFLVVVSILWIPVIQTFQNSRLFDYIQSVTSYLSPPIASLYFFSIMTKRVNEEGAFWSLIVGFIIGLIRFGWEFSYSVPPCGSEIPNPMPDVIQLHYLFFGIVLFIISALVLFVVSHMTKPLPDECTYGLTFFDRYDNRPRLNIPTTTDFWRKADVYFDVHEGLRQMADDTIENAAEEARRVHKTTTRSRSRTTSRRSITKEKITIKYALTEAGRWICGIEEKGLVDESEVAITMDTSIESSELWGTVCDISAVVLLSLSLFIWFFFTDYKTEIILFGKIIESHL